MDEPIVVGSTLEIVPDIYIISGAPFLIYKSHLILGDIHLGQEHSLFGSKGGQKISDNCKELTDLIRETLKQWDLDHVIINGDFKHNTYSITAQEKLEFNYLVNNIKDTSTSITAIRGNHDVLLEFLNTEEDSEIRILEQLTIDNILVFHGHQLPRISGQSILIMSHEHPAYTLRGYNRAQMKLPAFVRIDFEDFTILISPAANDISGGVDFSQRNMRFLSPYLQERSDMKQLQVFPFDKDIGILTLPPIEMGY